MHPRCTFAVSRWLFLRLLGVVYVVAFVSLAVQITGLVGGNGLLPVRGFLSRAYEAYGPQAYRRWPTLLWFSPSDGGLLLLCWGGALAALLLAAGFAPVPLAALLCCSTTPRSWRWCRGVAAGPIPPSRYRTGRRRSGTPA